MPTKSLSEIRQLFEKIFPNQTLRLRCLSLFVESIKYANCHAPDEWVVRYHPQTGTKGICLLVGSRTVFKLLKKKIWMALDRKQLEETTQDVVLLNKSVIWQWDGATQPLFLQRMVIIFFMKIFRRNCCP